MSIAVELCYQAKVNWSLLCAGVPLVQSVTLTNNDRTARTVKLRVRIARYWDTREIPVNGLEPGKSKAIDLSHIEQSFDLAILITHPSRTCIVVSVDDSQLLFPLDILMPDEWMAGVASIEGQLVLDSTLEWVRAQGTVPPGGICIQREKYREEWEGIPPVQVAVASLVMPEHPVVRNLKEESQLKHGKPFAECSAVEVMEALVGHLKTRCASFPDIEKYSLEHGSQRVRLPHEIFPSPDGPAHGARASSMKSRSGKRWR